MSRSKVGLESAHWFAGDSSPHPLPRRIRRLTASHLSSSRPRSTPRLYRKHVAADITEGLNELSWALIPAKYIWKAMVVCKKIEQAEPGANWSVMCPTHLRNRPLSS